LLYSWIKQKDVRIQEHDYEKKIWEEMIPKIINSVDTTVLLNISLKK
jgi:hypothetical protein